jgi:ketosteroid isomerase-like protein
MKKTNDLLDKLEIAQLLLNWGTWRDAGEFDKLRSCYTEDATMITSWFDGPAGIFVDRSVEMRKHQPRDRGAMHLIGGTTSEINGDKAFAETRITLLARGMVHDKLVDATVYGRFLDFLRKVNGDWRIQRRVPVYDKDALQLVVPGEALLLDAERLATLQVGFRHMAYMQSAAGLTISTTIPDPNSEEEKALYQSAQAWLKDKEGKAS